MLSYQIKNLLSVIFISVEDLELALNPKNRRKYKGEYDYEFLRGLYMILSGKVSMEDRKQFYLDSKIIKKESLVKDMQPLVLELDLAYANEVIEKQNTALQEMDTVLQEMDTVLQEMDTALQERDTILRRKNLKLANNLLETGQLDDLTQQESIDLIMEEVEVSYEEASDLYNKINL